MALSYDDLSIAATIDTYEVINNDYVQYTMRVGLANGSSVPWVVVRRFSDFESLLWALRPQGPPWSEQELPPKRWFNKHEPAFLEERWHRLQELIDTLLGNPLPPAPLRQFLEVEAHVDLDALEEQLNGSLNGYGGQGGLPEGADSHMGAGVNGDDRLRSSLAAESFRLNSIVNDTLGSLIDVTRDEYSSMDEVVEVADAAPSQRAAILADLAQWNNDDEAKRRQHLRHLPVASATVEGSEGELLDTLSRACAVALPDQRRLVERYGLILVDAVRQGSQVDAGAIGDGSDLVCHMNFTPAGL